MLDFTFHNPTTIVFGKTAMDQIAAYSSRYGKKIVLTYGGGSIKKNGIYDKVKAQLARFEVCEFGGIAPNPRVETLRKCVELCKEFQPDLILAVGGGSTIDGSKLISAAARYDGDAWDLVINQIRIENPIPLATVLTLSATGSEMNPGAVITNWTENIKLAYLVSDCYPVFSILDPQNTFSLPQDQTAYGTVDIFSHVLEQYLNQDVHAPIQDRFAEGILLTLIENGPIALKNPNDYDARANLMWASTLALNKLIGAGVPQDWATHGIEHQLSAFYDIPHGAGLAIVTPRWMDEVYPTKLAKFVQYGQRIWGIEAAGEQCARLARQKTFDFFQSLGVRMHLKDWNIDSTHFSVMVERTAGKIGETPLNKDQILRILDACL
ncbi:hypothetical protein AUK40_03095 [Candidatus Wirthbacteria bacterium CG2_30_54_11]|uniref:Uncharacterized protein n=1 Tax=Candidatus Wirthbacteria bacterium CG2_30_54_11 TaxID=1817892 RepID=A0A1J5J1V0_9BACT|nr:MAG: hypothetical protein AUK40_03095 [Candidatus Wirthbacteria bacterium CG2_30_54_11]